MMPLLAALDWHSVFFFLFASIAFAFGFGVLFSSNIVRMAFYLIISLGATSGLFFLAGAEFIGAMQIMIYVGGTLVLLIFGVMLTARKSFISMKTRGGEWVLAACIGGTLLVILIVAAVSVDDWKTPREDRHTVVREDVEDTTRDGAAFVGVRIDKLDADVDEKLKGGMAGYLLPFEIVSVHLLVVLIGAAYMARTKKRVATVGRREQEEETEPKTRSRLATGILGLALLSNVGGVLALLFAGSEVLQWAQDVQTKLPDIIADGAPQFAEAPNWFLPAMIVLLGVNAMALIALLGWQKWGFYALVVGVILIAIVFAQCFGIVHLLSVLLFGGILVGALFGALKMGGSRSVWGQLE